jgi:hypothetical protein
MNVQQTVQSQLGFWHGITDGMMNGCSDVVLHQNPPGAKVSSIAAIYAHAVISEDIIVHAMLPSTPGTPIYLSGGWQEKTGIAFPGIPPMQTDEWARGVRLDLAKFADYAKAVYAATDAYLASLTEANIAEKRDGGPFGEATLGLLVANLLGTHYTTHAGEIAALKGVHGLQGLPF